jgi:pimeloyl-ACP methyl ester carboxylesterase
VVAVMDALGLEKAALVGWSDGGNTALDLAIRYPSRVSALVAYAANFDLTGLKSGGGPAFSAYFARCAEDYAKLSPTPKDFAGLKAALSPMWKSEPTFTADQLAHISTPTLVLDGDHDEIIKQEHVKKLAALIPHAKLVLVKDASHFALFQQPKAFNDALLGFLSAAK